MFFSKIEKNLMAKENRYDLASATMNGSVRISFFSNSDNISFKG